MRDLSSCRHSATSSLPEKSGPVKGAGAGAPLDFRRPRDVRFPAPAPFDFQRARRLISGVAGRSVRRFRAAAPGRGTAESGVADIFQEIDEELRQDRAARLWKQYGAYVVALAVAIVLGVGGYRFWEYRDRTAREGESAAYEAALSQAAGGDAAGAIEGLGALAEDAGDGYAALARLRQAALAAREGDREGAALAYGAVAADDGAPAEMRDLASLASAAARIGTDPPGDLLPELDRIADAGGPWRPAALELKGALAIQTGDIAGAREIFSALSDDSATPARMRARAAEVLRALSGP